jgi:hypothetical protein
LVCWTGGSTTGPKDQIIAALLAEPRPEDTAEDTPADDTLAEESAEHTADERAADERTAADATVSDDGHTEDDGPADGGPADDGPADDGPDDVGPNEPGPEGPDAAGPDADGRVRTGIEIRVGLATLLGLDEQPGEIPGLGPVLAEVARAVVARQVRGAEWRFAVTDPDGYLLLAGVTRRRPRDTGVADRPSAPSRGGIVELQVPAEQLAQLAANEAGPAGRAEQWAAVVATSPVSSPTGTNCSPRSTAVRATGSRARH